MQKSARRKPLFSDYSLENYLYFLFKFKTITWITQMTCQIARICPVSVIIIKRRHNSYK